MERLSSKKLGEVGEKVAEDFLKSKGYSVIERNYKNKYGEIDLICRENKKIIFIEVKARYENQIGNPEDALNKKKIKKIFKNAEAYLFFKGEDAESRVEAVCVFFDAENKIKDIRHYEEISL